MVNSSSLLSTVILCRPDRVGDVIIATSCLEPLRRQRPELRLVFAAREVMRPLLEGHPLLDGFIALPAPGKGSRRRVLQAALGRGGLVEAIRAVGAEVVAHLHPDAAFQFAARAAGVPRRIGYEQSFLLDQWTLTDPRPDSRREGRLHEGQYNFELLAPLGITSPPLANLRPFVHLPPPHLETLRAKLSAAGWNPPFPSPTSLPPHPTSHIPSATSHLPPPFLVLNPTAFSLPLRWPPERFVSLARALRGDFERVVLVAERADDPSAVSIRRAFETAADSAWFIDLAGRTNLAELGWLLRHARLLVTRNTGTAHLASAVGCPLVELFGRLEGIYGPGRWRALGPATRIVTAAPDLARSRGESKQGFWRRCHAAIDGDEVRRAARELLDLPPGSASANPAPRD